MMKYGADPVEHDFALFCREVEARGQWVDVYLDLNLKEGQYLPNGLQEPGVLVICNHGGEPVQIVLQDEGCDCEYQFTLTEKAQIERFVEEQCKPQMLLASE